MLDTTVIHIFEFPQVSRCTYGYCAEIFLSIIPRFIALALIIQLSLNNSKCFYFAWLAIAWLSSKPLMLMFTLWSDILTHWQAFYVSIAFIPLMEVVELLTLPAAAELAAFSRVLTEALWGLVSLKVFEAQ